MQMKSIGVNFAVKCQFTVIILNILYGIHLCSFSKKVGRLHVVFCVCCI